MNNLPKVVTQQRRGRALNPRLLDRKSDALPLSHRATLRKEHLLPGNIRFIELSLLGVMQLDVCPTISLLAHKQLTKQQ